MSKRVKKNNTKRKKYIKKKNNKTNRKKYGLKKIFGGAPMTVNQRQNLITKYKIELDKLVNKVKNSISSVATEKDFYNFIDSKQYEVKEIVDKYICVLLMNDITPDTPIEQVVQEVNKYIKESIVDISKLRSKIPSLPETYPLVQSKDIIPIFINKYLNRMDIMFKYIKGYIFSIDSKLSALVFIFNSIYNSSNTNANKSKLYHDVFKIYEDKIKNFTDEVYTTETKNKKIHKMVTLMMTLAALESNFDLIKFIVFNNVDIQDYLVNKHKSIKDFILSYGDIRYIKMTRTIPIYNYWNSLVEKRTGMNIFDFRRKLTEYVKSVDVCRILREKLPGLSPVSNSVILDEFPYCYGLLLISVISYLLQDKCYVLLTGGKSIQLALYKYYLGKLDVDLTNLEMRNMVVNFIYEKYVEQYKASKLHGLDIDTSFYFVNTRRNKTNPNSNDPTYLSNIPIIKSKITSILEYQQDAYNEFIKNVKNIISTYISYDIDTRIILNDVEKLTPEERHIKSQVVARNLSLFIEWLAEDNGYLKFKYHRSSFSSTYKIGYLSDNKIRERMPSETTRSEESKHIYYNNEQEYQTQDIIDGMTEESKQNYESILNSKGEKVFLAKYYTEIIDVGYSTNKSVNKSTIETANLQFGDFNGLIEYQNLKEIVDDKLNDINVVYKDATKPNDVYYREKAVGQMNMFADFKYRIINEMIKLMKLA